MHDKACLHAITAVRYPLDCAWQCRSLSIAGVSRSPFTPPHVNIHRSLSMGYASASSVRVRHRWRCDRVLRMHRSSSGLRSSLCRSPTTRWPRCLACCRNARMRSAFTHNHHAHRISHAHHRRTQVHAERERMTRQLDIARHRLSDGAQLRWQMRLLRWVWRAWRERHLRALGEHFQSRMQRAEQVPLQRIHPSLDLPPVP